MVHFIWHVMTVRLFSLPLTKVGIHFGHVRMCATPYPMSWIIFILDLGPSYTDKLLEFIFLYCYKRDFMDSLNHDNQADIIEAFRLHYVNTLKQEHDGTRAYLETDTDEVSVVNAHLNDLPVKFSVCVNEGQDKLPTMYWLPKLHKRPYKARFIANSSSCTTTELSKLLTSCLTAIKSHVIRYCETVYETSNKNWLWSIKNSDEVLSKLKCRGFRATSLSKLRVRLWPCKTGLSPPVTLCY